MGSLSGSGRRASRRWAVTAGAAILVAVTIFAQRGEVAFDTASPPLATQIPSTIPAGGVNINDQVTLMPPVGRPTSLKSSKEATYAARKFGNAKFPTIAQLCTFTIPGSIPPRDLPTGTSVSDFRVIEGRLAWVVTFTSPKPMDVEVGKWGSHVGLFMTHLNVVLDANTGRFLGGFYTA